MRVNDDGLVRCGWADIRSGSHWQLYRNYHDQEWGRPVSGGVALFERMSLEVFQSGLSWLIVLLKRENFRRAFSGFDIEEVACYTDADVQRLLVDDGILRNRAKIEATIANARAAADLGSAADLSELLWSFAPQPRSRPADGSDVPSASAESKAMAHELKRRGFRFIGPTTAYALMQATGMVDDHIRACWVPSTR
ncbi:DNA-3-methyladenine glycosylase I [Mycobacterium uberis]|uniref:DNA-3-methyladenine glycosylase I n=1 Tax=Mycobacterium uberis TaxID=2162698 RepID=A0A3E1HK46_9MYCO|nr:DNA-3-methyladenine glycosylase I [Mycobacterium uberis]RFD26796.1 DNA-3-methyladenine glycosylase I [Mycobacterium uberis]